MKPAAGTAPWHKDQKDVYEWLHPPYGVKNSEEEPAKKDKKKDGEEKEGSLMQSQVDVHSDPICHSAGCVSKMAKDPPYPINYKVPNFGTDRPDVLTTWNSLDVAQKQLNHVWNYDPDAIKKPADPT